MGPPPPAAVTLGCNKIRGEARVQVPLSQRILEGLGDPKIPEQIFCMNKGARCAAHPGVAILGCLMRRIWN